ncbi:ABC transporter permease [Calidifontibacillus erzurumensis]|uniref:ABC transporter permease n=1 Tax=Calidifontibacillus erzurumensis TaxID=2741433 RepID=A0A8J8GDG3_9BACI|nr:ABC transporter permease [Calidifontibacillus erzurumensis]NSL51357.1 ABC transporter permease [Calidifontibacillus erzurumensis]
MSQKQLQLDIELLHKNFLLNIKKEKRWTFVWQLLIFITFFGIWEIASRKQWIDPLIFSSPTKVWHLFLEKVNDGTLLTNLQVTLFETVAGFILGTLIGTVFAAILWWSERLSKILDPYLVILNAMPKVALGPILIVALGPGYISIIAMGAIISVIITTIVVYTSFKEVDGNYIKVMHTFGASKMQIFHHTVLPASFPTIISTLKVNVGLSWVGVIVGEFLVSAKGLGYLIIYGFQVFNFTLVLMSLLIIAILATVMYQFVAWLENKLLKNRI